MAKKTPIHLTIDSDLYEHIMTYKALHKDFSISEKLEEWIRIVINEHDDEPETLNYDSEKAKLLLELKKLESKKELHERTDEREKEITEVIDRQIDNCLEYLKPSEKPSDVPDMRKVGLTFMLKSRFKKQINPLEAKDMIENRMKERGLI